MLRGKTTVCYSFLSKICKSQPFSKILFLLTPQMIPLVRKMNSAPSVDCQGPLKGFNCPCFYFVGKQKRASQGIFDKNWCTSDLGSGLKLWIPIDYDVIHNLWAKSWSPVTIPSHNKSKTHSAIFSPYFEPNQILNLI